MRGDLSETSAADACRDLARRGISGALALDGPDGPGRIVFVDGLLTAAVSPTPRARLGDRLVGAGLLDDSALTTALQLQADEPSRTRLGALLVDRGLVGRDAVRLFVQEQLLDAMFELIGWRYGTYEFSEGRPTEIPEVPVQLSVDDALVEVARRQHEWAELSQLIPDLEAVPTFRDQGSTATASLEPDEFAVLASVDGDRSIRQLANDLGYGEFEAARIVYGLALLGIVEVQIPQDEVGAALDEAFAYFSEASASEASAESEAQREPADEPTTLDVRPPLEAVTPLEGVVADALEPEPAEPEPAEPEPAATAEPEPAEPEPAAADEAPAAPFPIDDDLGAILEALRDEPLPGHRSSEPTPAPSTEPAGDLPTFVAPPDEPWHPQPETATAASADDAATEPARQRSDDLPSFVDPPDAPAPPAEDDTPGASAPPAEDPGAPAPPAEDDTPGAAPAASDPAPRPEPNSSADVSEFLRELSRLAIDEPPPRREEPRSEPDEDAPPRTPATDDSKKKKRGLFGWGG